MFLFMASIVRYPFFPNSTSTNLYYKSKKKLYVYIQDDDDVNTVAVFNYDMFSTSKTNIPLVILNISYKDLAVLLNQNSIVTGIYKTYNHKNFSIIELLNEMIKIGLVEI
nr:hypothetical protein [Microctonus hyperodae filamentous virus]